MKREDKALSARAQAAGAATVVEDRASPVPGSVTTALPGILAISLLLPASACQRSFAGSCRARRRSTLPGWWTGSCQKTSRGKCRLADIEFLLAGHMFSQVMVMTLTLAWLFDNCPMRVPFLRWRFPGGRIV